MNDNGAAGLCTNCPLIQLPNDLFIVSVVFTSAPLVSSDHKKNPLILL